MYSSTVLSIRRIFMLSMIAASLFALLPQNSAAQCGGTGQLSNVSSAGQDFLLIFMKNVDAGDGGQGHNYQDIYLASNADTQTTVTITCKQYPNFGQEITLAPRAYFVYHLSLDTIIGAFGNDALMEFNEVVDFTVFRVKATKPITCYGMSAKWLSADAFLALPKNVAGTHFIVMSYYNSLLAGMEMPSEFAVAAFEDSTEVTIIPSATTKSGASAGMPLHYTLNEGEGVQILSETNRPHLDMTGSQVTSNKPIVVYGGHARTEAPVDFVPDDGGALSRDHLCEAMPPVSTWGASFIAKNFKRKYGDVLRVLASVDNTVVKINGKVWGKPLAAYAFRDTIIDYDDGVALKNVVSVETDTGHRILVGMIAHTAGIDATGDPFLAIVPPLNQTYTDFTYFITDNAVDYYANQQFLIIVTEKSGVGNISIDGSVLPKLLFTDVPPLSDGKQYAITELNQSAGIHHIRSSGLATEGFTILAYGWGEKLSYGYTAGALLKPIAPLIALKSPTHSVAPFPGDTIAKLPPPGILVRNTLMERIYFDKAEITYSQNKHNIPVRLKKDIALETGTIEAVEEKHLELVAAAQITETIVGNVRIWYHSRLWFDLWPVDFPFVITPQQQADVKGSSEQTALLENYPNPVSGKTTVRFAVPRRAYGSVKIYDALGRVVRTLTQGIINAGEQTLNVNTKGIVPGDYTLELLAPELGISEHRHMVVIE